METHDPPMQIYSESDIPDNNHGSKANTGITAAPYLTEIWTSDRDTSLQNASSFHEVESLDRKESRFECGDQMKEIAVGANKGPSFYFSLAKKILVKDEICELRALEGAILFAIDAAHLLERSKYAKIVRIQTSYAPVPRRGLFSSTGPDDFLSDHRLSNIGDTDVHTSALHDQSPSLVNVTTRKDDKSRAKPLHRARISITVQRTDLYKKWLEDNPDHLAEVCEEHDNES